MCTQEYFYLYSWRDCLLAACETYEAVHFVYIYGNAICRFKSHWMANSNTKFCLWTEKMSASEKRKTIFFLIFCKRLNWLGMDGLASAIEFVWLYLDDTAENVFFPFWQIWVFNKINLLCARRNESKNVMDMFGCSVLGARLLCNVYALWTIINSKTDVNNSDVSSLFSTTVYANWFNIFVETYFCLDRKVAIDR